MPAVIGTAGHIDHGKTALVRALTGVDTDRLKEEKARGITIELGFAEVELEGGLRAAVVDVPGHEAFVRTMVAGATGIDVALLVVAADEGVMPQTTEHLSVLELLGVPEAVVALTKVDLVEQEWRDLVTEDLRATLAAGPYADAPIQPTSVRSGEGLDALRRSLTRAVERSRQRRSDDIARLPVDRVFHRSGAGTVVTGTLWSGELQVGQEVTVLPAGRTARIRRLQRHGADVRRAGAGSRVAAALSGAGADRSVVERGSTLADAPDWSASRILTVRASVVRDAGWTLAHNQRLHLHLGTSEVRARVALLEARPLGPGESGWVQLRLEEPLVARVRDRVILRSYSPVTTIAGGAVAERSPPRRRDVDDGTRRRLEALLHDDVHGALSALLELRAWAGVAVADLPLELGVPPAAAMDALRAVQGDGATLAQDRAYGAAVSTAADERLLQAVERGHADRPLDGVLPLSTVAAALPAWAPPGLQQARLEALQRRGEVELRAGGVRRAGHRVRLTAAQEAAVRELADLYAAAGLAPPAVADLPPSLAERPDVEDLLHLLVRRGDLVVLDGSLYFDRRALAEAADRVRGALAGRTGLGPADFRPVLEVSRRYLLPILAHLDAEGVTLRRGGVRDVTPVPQRGNETSV